MYLYFAIFSGKDISFHASRKENLAEYWENIIINYFLIKITCDYYLKSVSIIKEKLILILLEFYDCRDYTQEILLKKVKVFMENYWSILYSYRYFHSLFSSFKSIELNGEYNNDSNKELVIIYQD